jgi:hypothetical protein
MWIWFFHPLWCRRHHRRTRIVIKVGGFAVELIPEEVVHMATSMNVGQTLPMSIEYLDQHGVPMTTAPLLDAPPVWANNTPATETLTAASDGHTASSLALAAGTDTVRLTLMVGGVQFAATLDVTVAAVVPIQTLTTIAIVPGIPTP